MKAYARLIIVLGVTALLVIGIIMGVDSSWTRLQEVTMTIDPNSTQVFLFKKIEAEFKKELSDLSGRRVWSVSLNELMKQVEADRRVKTVRISRQFPNRIAIEVTPQHPIVALVDEAGRFLPIAMDASLLPAVATSEALDVPLLRGKQFSRDQSLRERAIQIVDSLPKNGPLQASKVAEISHDSRLGFSLLLNQGGMLVHIGEGDVGLKASRIEKVLNYLNDQQLRGRVIDARFEKKVVVRLRNGL